MDFKITWFAWLLICCFAATSIFAQRDRDMDDDEDFGDEDNGAEIVCEGSGSSETGAYGDAWRSGMRKWIKDNWQDGDFASNEKGLTAFLEENWKNYIILWDQDNEDLDDAMNVQIMTRYGKKRGRVKFRGRIDGDKLLKDVKGKFTKARDKLEGLSAAFLPDDYKKFKAEKLDADIMYDSIQGGLQKHMVTKDLRAIDELIKVEAQALGNPSSADPGAFIARKFNEVNLMVYLWMTTDVMDDEAAQTKVWKATIGCRIVWRPTAQEIVHFQIDSLRDLKTGEFSGVIPNREARQRIIDTTAKAVVKKIVFEVSNFKMPTEEGVYQIKFVKFDSDDMKKIDKIEADLSTGKRADMKVLKGGTASEGYYMIKIKWRSDADSQSKLVRVVKEACLEHGLRVKQGLSSQGSIVFVPEGDLPD